MKFNKEQVKHLANLARLDISDKDLEAYNKDLQDILSYVEKINKLDLGNVPESLRGLDEISIGPRPDSIESSDPQAIESSCQKDGLYVVTPNVFNNK
jgi:aspartyl-tRNA(Asn)/glutamyl-tRNA(Gln) amidotransferase subunit C